VRLAEERSAAVTDEPTRDADADLDPVIARLRTHMDESGAADGDGEGGSSIPAGHPPPSPASLDDIGIAHAIDGDGTALCQPNLRLEQVDDYYWNDVPRHQRCLVCAATLEG
jgi:hypothetical protein